MRHHFTPDEIQRLIVNPFYAITVAWPLIARRSASPVEGISQWLARNAPALATPAEEGGGAGEAWLRRLLDILQHNPTAADPANPARAIAIAPTFAVEHEPLITEAMWVRSNGALRGRARRAGLAGDAAVRPAGGFRHR